MRFDIQYCNKFYKLRYKRVLRGLEKAVEKEDINPIAKEREKIVLFYRNNGLKITQEAFDVKRSTLYNWQKEYKEFGIIRYICLTNVVIICHHCYAV
jgi:hypothetical protein